MNAINGNRPKSISFGETIRSSIVSYLDEVAKDASSPLNGLDRWTQRRVMAEAAAKTELVLESNDPVEHCYQNLIREIDVEGEMGVLLANNVVGAESLVAMCADPGVSGELYREMERIAPAMFPDEFAHSDGDLDLVWASVQARFDRAQLEAGVSQLIMQHFLDSAESADDMTDALRSMFYTFHEEGIRRQFDMTSLLDQREAHELFIMVSELMQRAGSYEDRTRTIAERAGTV